MPHTYNNGTCSSDAELKELREDLSEVKWDEKLSFLSIKLFEAHLGQIYKSCIIRLMWEIMYTESEQESNPAFIRILEEVILKSDTLN